MSQDLVKALLNSSVLVAALPALITAAVAVLSGRYLLQAKDERIATLKEAHAAELRVNGPPPLRRTSLLTQNGRTYRGDRATDSVDKWFHAAAPATRAISASYAAGVLYPSDECSRRRL